MSLVFGINKYEKKKFRKMVTVEATVMSLVFLYFRNMEVFGDLGCVKKNDEQMLTFYNFMNDAFIK